MLERDRGFGVLTLFQHLERRLVILLIGATGHGQLRIVAGRGRIDQDYSSDNIKDKDPAGTTRPRVIQNTREDFETHKNLGLDENIMSKVPPDPDSGNLYDVPEGDPDFLHDASRVYVSMIEA